MIAVVADTSPLNYLVQIGCDHLLVALYERILIPGAVLRELENPGTPAPTHEWLRHVRVAEDPEPGELDPGERHAIQLAKDENADLLLMDERAGVAVARRRGLLVTGTQGVLLRGAALGLVDMDVALVALQA